MKKAIEHILNLGDYIPNDLEEYKSIYNELKRGIEFLKSIILAIPDDILIIDENREIIWSNKKEIKGLSLNEIENIFENSDFKHGCPIEFVFQNKDSVHFETKVENKNFLNTISPCNYNGHVSTILLLRRDITETKRIEEFKQLEELISEVVKSQEALTKTLIKKD